MNKRFSAIRAYKQMSLQEFGDKIGLSASGVSALEYGTRRISGKHIRLIAAAFPDINTEWLETGEGSMLRPTTSDAISEVAAEYNLGPGGVKLLEIIAQIFKTVGPEAVDEIIRTTLPELLGDIPLNPVFEGTSKSLEAINEQAASTPSDSQPSKQSD